MERDIADQTFREQVLAEPGGEYLYRCYACGTCASMCLVRRVNPDFNPRRILEMVMLDMKERVLSSPTVWLCSACDLCYSVCPQEIHISELMRAIRNIAIQEGYEPPGPFALVADDICSGCGLCVSACPYGAIELVTGSAPTDGQALAVIDKVSCMGCGICAAACPSEAISIDEASREQIAVTMGAGEWFTGRGTTPKLVVFLCDWCVRAENDLAGLDRLPSHIRLVHVSCTGHLDPSLALTALTHGADGVLVVGCLPGQCHYQSGNLLARRRIAELKPLLDALGIGSARLGLEWVSTSARGKVGRVVEAFAESIRQLGPSPISGGPAISPVLPRAAGSQELV